MELSGGKKPLPDLTKSKRMHMAEQWIYASVTDGTIVSAEMAKRSRHGNQQLCVGRLTLMRS